ncbi:MAG TPA: FAD-dependent oxidoreductase [Aliiroseovarius sp.]|nr:FAD-dependent oxidoreductase [Aliiroseovarius sp.]
MTEHPLTHGAPIDVAVIGGGPAGLAAATALRQAGVGRVVVLEREPQAGGIPRHCGHPPFGMREFRRVLRGPDYAARLVERARRAGVEVHTQATVAELRPGPELLLALPEGLFDIAPRRVILATGVREKPRPARLIGGARVQGVVNTGALQSMIYLKHLRPFRRPVIVGSELVAFSAIMTSRHAGIRPVAMVEPNRQVTARWPAALYPRLNGIPLLTGTRVLEILGESTVSGLRVAGPDGAERVLDCDGVVLSGQFTPESALARCGHLAVDPATGGPVVDQWGRATDPAYFVTGNLLRPVETAGWSWAEGQRTGGWVARDLAGGLAKPEATLELEVTGDALKYVMPQRLVLPGAASAMTHLQFRVTRPVRGALVAIGKPGVVWQRKIHARPERRLLVPVSEILGLGVTGRLRFEVRDTSG